MTENHKNGCCICDEIKEHQLPTAYQAAYGIKTRVCIETGKFVVFPTVSPLVTGHMLIFSKPHIPSMSVLPTKDLKPLLRLVHKVASKICRDGETPYFFEHGVLEDGKGSCGIAHAHLHILPLKSEIVSKISEQASLQFRPNYFGPLEVLMQNVNGNSPYLLFGADISNLKLALSESIQSQFMRRLIAEAIGLKDWDWKLLNGAKSFGAALRVFSRPN